MMKKPTSGFVHNIGEEMVGMGPADGQFANLSECYVSPSGHARLFTATRYGKRYMLKCLKEDFAYVPIYQQALRKEFEIGLQLDHPHVCHTIGLEQVEGLGTTIVMEYIDGLTLQELLDRHQLTAALAHRIADQLLDALEYLHNKQILHRDLKPSNIMLTHQGHQQRLIDFSLSDSDAFSVLKSPAGTSGYIAPELLLSDRQTDVRADIYSLGMVLADMAEATGCRRLHAMAQACSQRDASRRPASIAQVRALAQTDRRLRGAVIVLAAIGVVLAMLIAYKLLCR